MQLLEWLPWLIPGLPFLAFLLILFFGKRIGGKEEGWWIGIAGVGGAALIALITLYLQLNEGGHTEVSYTWLALDRVHLEWGLLVDNVSVILATIVSFISLMVVVYSGGYMHAEDGRRRYYAEVTLFIGAMLGTVLANNFLQMFIFWEIMGLCSYLLIGFWFRKPSAAAAAKKAFLITRIGDTLLFLGIVALFAMFGTLNYHELAGVFGTSGYSVGMLTLVTLFLFGGAVGKSAQFPLHIWLPDAMEGPTTVSALIHAATMVNAGVYLTARALPLMVHTPTTLIVVGAIGGITALVAASLALVQRDIKKVLAYSTVSQLGYMILGLGAGGYILYVHSEEGLELVNNGMTFALYHLVNHAFFKGLLFLGAGSVIHGALTQDMFKMGGLRKYMPITAWTMFIATLAISGIPPFSGFWSKDELLGAVWESGQLSQAGGPVFLILWVLGIITAFLTAFYMFRLWFLTFWDRPAGFVDVAAKGAPVAAGVMADATPAASEESGAHHEPAKSVSHDDHHLPHESPGVMTIPLVILAACVLFSSVLIFTPDFIHAFEFEFTDAAGILVATEPGHFDFGHFLGAWGTWLSVIIALAGVGFAYGVYVSGSLSGARELFKSPIGKLLDNKYYLDDAFRFIGYGILAGVARFADLFDRYVIDGIVMEVAGFFMQAGRVLRRMATGALGDYLGYLVAGAALLVIFVVAIAPTLQGVFGG